MGRRSTSDAVEAEASFTVSSSPMERTFSLAQIEPTLGDVATNLARHVQVIEAEIAAGSDVVLFPELSLTGYFLKDQVPDVGRPRDGEELETIRHLSARISIGVGFCELGREGQFYNSYAFFEDGELLHVHRKVHLVTYGMFEESRDFAEGSSFRAFDSRHGRFGVLICEDAWHTSSAYLYFLADVDMLLVPSAGPGRGVDAHHGGQLASTRTWETLTTAMALHHQTWVLYVNRVGFEDGILFGGGSRVVDPFGVESAALAGFEPGVLRAGTSSELLHRARVGTPLRRDATPWLLERELERIEREAENR